jgi:hypothetical protein
MKECACVCAYSIFYTHYDKKKNSEIKYFKCIIFIDYKFRHIIIIIRKIFSHCIWNETNLNKNINKNGFMLF